VALNAWPGELLTLLYGATFNTPEAIECLSLLALVIPVVAVRGHGQYALIGIGHQRREFTGAFFASLLLLFLLARWVPESGAVGAARSMLVSEFAGLIVTWLLLWYSTRKPAGLGEQPA
jgi:O-antigen/teichoic acid export membrane protein